MSGTWNSPTSPYGYTPPTGLTSFGQTSGTPQISPLTSPAERGAIETLMRIASSADPAGTSAKADPGSIGPSGARSSGNFGQDLTDFGRAAGQIGLSTLTNPTGIPGAVVGTMVGALARGIADIPNPQDLASAWGVRGALTGLQEAFMGISPQERHDRETAQAIAAQMEALAEGRETATTSYGAGHNAAADNQNTNSTATGQDGLGNDGTGAGGAGMGAGAPGNDSDNGENYAGGGLIALAGGGKIATGPGGGLDDLIPTSIDGRRAAALSDGEFVVPADVVSMFGDGSSAGGARRLYDLVRSVRENKTGTSQQAGPLPIGDILKRSLR